jgi:hypothetical protein
VNQYKIDIRHDETIQEFEVILHGPGLESEGKRYIFRHTCRAEVFAETVNFVYQQGFRDGLRSRSKEDRRVLLVTGTTPDNVNIQAEGWWAKLKRLCRARIS